MGSLPPGVSASALLHELVVLQAAFTGDSDSDQAETPASPEALEAAMRAWRAASRTQLPRGNHLSAAVLGFACVLRRLSTQPPPDVAEVDGQALLLAGLLTESDVDPSTFKQTVLMDTLAAIRAYWATEHRIRGFGDYIAALRHRGAILANFAATPDVLDDGRYAAAVRNSPLLVPSTQFVLDLENFFYDVAVQLEWSAAAVPVVVDADAVLAVTGMAQATMHTHKVGFAAAAWFALHWETLVGPGERDAYRRARPNLNTDARSVLAAFRGHVLNGNAACTEAVLADPTDVRSVMTLAQRVWGRKLLSLTPTEAPISKPTLRIVCGRFLLIDRTGVFHGTPFQLVTALLALTGVKLTTATEVHDQLQRDRASDANRRKAVFALAV
jgi:hypothetical protein